MKSQLKPFKSSQKQQYTDLYWLIYSKLCLYSQPIQLQSLKFTDQIECILLSKTPLTHTFICNYTHSVQIQFKHQRSKPIEKYDLNVFNKILNHYYSYPQADIANGQKVNNDIWKVQFTLNASDRQLLERYGQIQFKDGNDKFGKIDFTESTYEPEPYQPYFYFRTNFKEFLIFRQHLSLQQTFLDTIKITEWSIKIVNISKSGAFGIVIQVYKFRYNQKKIYFDSQQSNKRSLSTYSNSMQDQSQQKNKNKEIDFKNIGSIIYQKPIQNILQRMRCQIIKKQTMKQLKSQMKQQNQQNQVSICYHLRSQTPIHKLPKTSQFVYLDKHQEIIKFNPTLPVHYLPFGQLQGMCTFPQSLNLKRQEKQQNLKQLNFLNLKILEQVLNKEILQKKKKRKSIKNVKSNARNIIQSQSFSQIMRQKADNSFYKSNIIKSIKPTFIQSDSDSLWSDSNEDQDAENIQQNQDQEQYNKEQNQSQGKYYRIVSLKTDKNRQNQNQSSNSMQQSSDQQENQYFKRYREQSRKQGGFK